MVPSGQMSWLCLAMGVLNNELLLHFSFLLFWLWAASWLAGLAGLAGCLVEWRMRTTRTREHDMLVICWACPVWVACEGSNAMHVAHGEGREDHQDSSNLRILAIVPSSSSSQSQIQGRSYPSAQELSCSCSCSCSRSRSRSRSRTCSIRI